MKESITYEDLTVSKEDSSVVTIRQDKITRAGTIIINRWDFKEIGKFMGWLK